MSLIAILYDQLAAPVVFQDGCRGISRWLRLNLSGGLISYQDQNVSSASEEAGAEW